MDKMALKIAGMLRNNDVNFESALNLWAHLKIENVEILNDVYSDPKNNYTDLTFMEILSENG